MPLEIQSYPLDAEHLDTLAGVLRDNADVQARLAGLLGSTQHQLWAGIFNARPVSLLLLASRDGAWWVTELVVHPATRGRGVGSETLRQTARRQPLRWPAEISALARRAGLAD